MKNIKLIKTDLYLLLIDEEAGIDINNYIVAEDLSGIAKVKEYEKGHILAIAIFQNIELGISYHQTSDWNKIIAYYPLTKEAKELDLPLLPNPFEEVVDTNIQTRNFNKQVKNPYLTEEKEYQVWERAYVEGFNDGVAQPKQFSLEDMYRVAIKVANRVSRPEYGEIININEIVDTYIQSLSTQQLPSEFIPEWTQTPPAIFRENDVPYAILKTITNSEGKQELIGTYKY